jgi:hypothetical protein
MYCVLIVFDVFVSCLFETRRVVTCPVVKEAAMAIRNPLGQTIAASIHTHM